MPPFDRQRGWFLAALLGALGLWVTDVRGDCECPELSPSAALQQATYAFSGLVSEVRKDRKTGAQTFVFDVIDSFKGNPDPEMTLADSQAGEECALEIKEGGSYMVYARWEWADIVTSRCFGTKPLEKALPDASKLGPSNDTKDLMYEQLQKLCMGHQDTPCCLASIKAMSADHYLPEPEEGCPGGTIPDRLKCAGSLRWCIPDEEADHRKVK